MPILLQAISGLDPMDSTSANVEVPNFAAALTGDIKGLKIAVPKEYLGEGVGEEVRQVRYRCTESFRRSWSCLGGSISTTF